MAPLICSHTIFPLLVYTFKRPLSNEPFFLELESYALKWAHSFAWNLIHENLLSNEPICFTTSNFAKSNVSRLLHFFQKVIWAMTIAKVCGFESSGFSKATVHDHHFFEIKRSHFEL